jgi:hypothetical protein
MPHDAPANNGAPQRLPDDERQVPNTADRYEEERQ